MEARFICKKLKKRQGIWRVDGVQEISDHGRLGTGVKIYFSEILSSEVSNPYRTASRSCEVIVMRYHTGKLCEFIIGSVWRDGELVYSPPVIPDSVVADVSRCRFVSLDEVITLKGQQVQSLIHESYFALGKNRGNLSKTHYAIVPILGNGIADWLIVPCSELLRFYYGVSSRLLSGTLAGRLDNYISWKKSRFEDGKLILHVNQLLDRSEQFVFCRAVASDNAKAAMLGIHNHLSSIQVNNQTLDKQERKQLTIQANFPFKDKTVLQVAGKKMKLGTTESGRDQWAVFAMEIVKCMHPVEFPIPPTVETDFSMYVGNPIHGNGDPGSNAPRNHPELPQNSQDMPIGDDASNARLPKLAILNYSNRFGAMDGWRFQYDHQGVIPTGVHSSFSNGIPIDNLSIGDGSTEKDAENTLGVGLHQNHIDRIDRDITLFLETLGCLRTKLKARNWSIETLALKNRIIEGNEVIAMFPQNFGKKWSWHQVIEADGEKRPRQAIIAKITNINNNKVFYILEMELKPGESGQCTILLHSRRLTPVDNDCLESLLRLTVIQNRWILESNKWKKDSDKKLADTFFLAHIMLRINHLQIQRQQSDEKGNKTIHLIKPETWAAYLLEKIDEVFPNNLL